MAAWFSKTAPTPAAKPNNGQAVLSAEPSAESLPAGSHYAESNSTEVVQGEAQTAQTDDAPCGEESPSLMLLSQAQRAIIEAQSLDELKGIATPATGRALQMRCTISALIVLSWR